MGPCVRRDDGRLVTPASHRPVRRDVGGHVDAAAPDYSRSDKIHRNGAKDNHSEEGEKICPKLALCQNDRLTFVVAQFIHPDRSSSRPYPSKTIRSQEHEGGGSPPNQNSFFRRSDVEVVRCKPNTKHGYRNYDCRLLRRHQRVTLCELTTTEVSLTGFRTESPANLKGATAGAPARRQSGTRCRVALLANAFVGPQMHLLLFDAAPTRSPLGLADKDLSQGR